jgi:hypothetical protein
LNPLVVLFQLYIGSFISNTFLPGGNLNLTLCLHWSDMDRWFIRINEVLCTLAVDSPVCHTDDGPISMSVKNVSFINSNIKLVSSLVNGMATDISCNEIHSLFQQALIEKVDSFIGNNHLFKRSLILIKAWWTYDACKQQGISKSFKDINGYTLGIMIMWVFNKYGVDITTPLQVFVRFLEIYGSFDWDHYSVTAFGPVPLTVKTDADGTTSAGNSAIVDTSHVADDVTDTVTSSATAHEDDPVSTTTVSESVDINISGYDASKSYFISPNIFIDLQERQCFYDNAVKVQKDKARSEGHIIPQDSSITEKIDLETKLDINDSDNMKVIGMKICDPLSLTGSMNLISKLEANDCSLLKSTFHSALCDYLIVCQKAKDNNNKEFLSSLTLFFKNTMSMLNNIPWQETIKLQNKTIITTTTLDTHYSDLEVGISMAEIMLGSIIETCTLQNVIILILQTKGPLPVGEIGKYLQDLAGMFYILHQYC